LTLQQGSSQNEQRYGRAFLIERAAFLVEAEFRVDAGRDLTGTRTHPEPVISGGADIDTDFYLAGAFPPNTRLPVALRLVQVLEVGRIVDLEVRSKDAPQGNDSACLITALSRGSALQARVRRQQPVTGHHSRLTACLCGIDPRPRILSLPSYDPGAPVR